MSDQLWERAGPWVQRRWGLTDEQIARLREIGVLPLPSGEVHIPPHTILAVWERLERLESAAVSARPRSRRSGRRSRAPADYPPTPPP